MVGNRGVAKQTNWLKIEGWLRREIGWKQRGCLAEKLVKDRGVAKQRIS